MMRTYWGDALEVTPAVEDIVLSLMRVRPDGTIAPYLSRANHFRILRAIWEQDAVALHARLRAPAEALLARRRRRTRAWAARRRAAARASGRPAGRVRLTWIEGIHDLPLQRPADVARRLERFARARRRMTVCGSSSRILVLAAFGVLGAVLKAVLLVIGAIVLAVVVAGWLGWRSFKKQLARGRPADAGAAGDHDDHDREVGARRRRGSRRVRCRAVTTTVTDR